MGSPSNGGTMCDADSVASVFYLRSGRVPADTRQKEATGGKILDQQRELVFLFVGRCNQNKRG